MKYEIRDSPCLPRRLPMPAPFRQQFSSTRRGARLGRLLAAQQLTDWGWPRGGEQLEAAELVVGELAANAVTHGRVPGRDFLLTMALTRSAEGGFDALRIEVADSRGERLPTPMLEPCPDGERGRGLVLVSALATRWGVVPRFPSGKTVWAELPSPPE
ncbi:ATP-binding protein [Streptomyces sp. NPDC088337]|uniref:ATP-binding protein n=1 Tax=unclassified Streptomyces TaxID=2593676 RepID=UPI0037FFE5C0